MVKEGHLNGLLFTKSLDEMLKSTIKNNSDSLRFHYKSLFEVSF